MDFLFLNESASAADNGEMEAWLESTYGVSGQTDKNQSLGDFMLDYQEAMHEAEIQSMKDEFKLYQEEAMGIQHEGVIDTVKNWWRKIVEWITKAWNKILHWIEVAYAFIRKKVQEWYMKLRDRKIVYIREDLSEFSSDFGKVTKKFEETGSTMTQAIAELNKPGTPATDYSTKADKMDEIKERVKEMWADAKKAFDDHKEAFNDPKGGKNYKPGSIATWKKAVDDAVKAVENARKDALKNKAQYFKNIKAIDTKINEAVKAFNADDKDTTKANTVKQTVKEGNCLKYILSFELKRNSLAVNAAKWYLSKTINSIRSKEAED